MVHPLLGSPTQLVAVGRAEAGVALTSAERSVNATSLPNASAKVQQKNEPTKKAGSWHLEI